MAYQLDQWTGGIFSVYLKGLLAEPCGTALGTFFLVNVSQTVFFGIFAFLEVVGVSGAKGPEMSG